MKDKKAKESKTFVSNLAILLDSGQQYERRGLFYYTLPTSVTLYQCNIWY